MSRWGHVAERNRAARSQNAERVLADTAFDPLRSPRALVVFVGAYVLTTVAMPVCWVVWGSIPGVISFVAWLVVFLLLRVAVRSQADLPDDVLDERMRAERDSVYVGAFRLVSTAVFVVMTAAFVAVAFSDEQASITLDYHSVSALYWTTLSLLLGAPSVVLAMRKRSTGID